MKSVECMECGSLLELEKSGYNYSAFVTCFACKQGDIFRHAIANLLSRVEKLENEILMIELNGR